MKLTFKHWLFDQKGRKDQIGKLARAMAKVDYSYIQSGRKPDEHKKWARIITRHGRAEHVLAFNRAWREYQTEKQEVQEVAIQA